MDVPDAPLSNVPVDSVFLYTPVNCTKQCSNNANNDGVHGSWVFLAQLTITRILLQDKRVEDAPPTIQR